jgi:hypothetical protein
MTAAAARTAEMFAEEILAGTLTLEPVSPPEGDQPMNALEGRKITCTT